MFLVFSVLVILLLMLFCFILLSKILKKIDQGTIICGYAWCCLHATVNNHFEIGKMLHKTTNTQYAVNMNGFITSREDHCEMISGRTKTINPSLRQIWQTCLHVYTRRWSRYLGTLLLTKHIKLPEECTGGGMNPKHKISFDLWCLKYIDVLQK